MNCVVGLVHKYYGDDLLRDLLPHGTAISGRASWTI